MATATAHMANVGRSKFSSYLARMGALRVLACFLSASLIVYLQSLSFYLSWSMTSSSDATNLKVSDLIDLNRSTIELHPEEACNHTIHSTETFWIAMPAWDDREGLHRALNSVHIQTNTGYRKIRVVVFEDYSTENMFSVEEKMAYERIMNVTFLRNEVAPNKGSAYGKWVLFEWIRRHALPHEYTLVLDGDDTLADSWVVQDIHVSFLTTAFDLWYHLHQLTFLLICASHYVISECSPRQEALVCLGQSQRKIQ